jgi:hypothetical protein
LQADFMAGNFRLNDMDKTETESPNWVPNLSQPYPTFDSLELLVFSG